MMIAKNCRERMKKLCFVYKKCKKEGFLSALPPGIMKEKSRWWLTLAHHQAAHSRDFHINVGKSVVYPKEKGS
jgi:hypothetical protein